MEDKLANDKQYKAYVIVLLTWFMGDNLSETVRKIMQKLFTDNFLAYYSFVGFKDFTENDIFSISGLEVAGTDLCLKKMSHLAYEFKQFYDNTKTSLTNIKFDIKNLVYTVNEIKSMMEHVVIVLNTSGSLSNENSHSILNILNT
uniref:Uncharacterized protein n=1 Tax=Sipha flava TaxID=143950 RepID=A0A2S2QS51_9HEMI